LKINSNWKSRAQYKEILTAPRQEGRRPGADEKVGASDSEWAVLQGDSLSPESRSRNLKLRELSEIYEILLKNDPMLLFKNSQDQLFLFGSQFKAGLLLLTVLVRPIKRQRKTKGCTFSFLTGYPDFSSVQLYQLLA
jgi:hypothetical protein